MHKKKRLCYFFVLFKITSAACFSSDIDSDTSWLIVSKCWYLFCNFCGSSRSWECRSKSLVTCSYVKCATAGSTVFADWLVPSEWLSSDPAFSDGSSENMKITIALKLAVDLWKDHIEPYSCTQHGVYESCQCVHETDSSKEYNNLDTFENYNELSHWPIIIRQLKLSMDNYVHTTIQRQIMLWMYVKSCNYTHIRAFCCTSHSV